jgi:hypothetical protein
VNKLNFTTLYKNEIEKAVKNISLDTIGKILNKNLLYIDNKSNTAFNLNKATYNLINYDITNGIEKNLKYILISEAYDIENTFPCSGDVFLELFMKYYKNKSMSITDYIIAIVENVDFVKKAEKSDINSMIDDFECEYSQKIINEIILLSSANTSFFLNESLQEKCFIHKTDKLNFNLEFDNRFLIKKTWTSSNFNFIIIDGFIQEVSEIHHLLMKASETKEDYVLFCKGASEEVKNTILVNLKRGTINIFPVCLKVNEANVNILNDIATCLESDIVSALNGDTISISVRRELKKGEHIKITNDTISLKILSKIRVENQKKYLRKKLTKILESDPNYPYISSRIRNLESDKIEIKLGEINNCSNIKDNINIFLKFVKNCQSGIVVFKNSITSKKTKNFTLKEFITILKKLKSTVEIIDNIECALILDNKK